MKTLIFDSIPSTNDYLKEHVDELNHMTCCIAKHQTKGKGRLGRVWEDDQTQALFSMLMKDKLTTSDLSLIPFYTAQTVHQVLSKEVDFLTIKWPNDIYIGDKKVAGILIESIIENNHVQAIVVGVGINVNTQTFPDYYRHTPTSLFLETARKWNVWMLIDQIFARFETQWHNRSTEEVIQYVNHFSYLNGKTIAFEINQIEQQGEVKQILLDGSLLVQTEVQTLKLHSGEVSIIKKR